MQEKISICLNRGREETVGNDNVSIVCSRKYEMVGWRKDRKSRRDRLGSYLDTLLGYVLSVTFCGAVVLKVMDQETLVKRRWSYKVRTTVYIKTLGEFARHEFTNLWLETLPDTSSFSLFDRNKTQLAGRWTIYTEIRRKSNLCADLFPAHRQWTECKKWTRNSEKFNF